MGCNEGKPSVLDSFVDLGEAGAWGVAEYFGISPWASRKTPSSVAGKI